MKSVMIERRFCGPPNSANGGYVCGLLARHIDGDAEITLLAPPPLDQKLDLVASEQGVELRKGEIALARGRSVLIDLPEIPVISYAAAEDAVGRSPYDESRHPLPTCFVCGPARARGDGLRLIPGPLQRPLPAYSCEAIGTVAAPWVPYLDLAGEDGAVAPEFVWAALDCPTGFAGVGAQHLGMTGAETILLGRMSGRINRRPYPGDECVIVAWPTGRDGRKLFADGALLGPDGEILAVARATWLLVDRKVQLGEKATG
jgi:hypothetical protein